MTISTQSYGNLRSPLSVLFTITFLNVNGKFIFAEYFTTLNFVKSNV